MKGPTKIRAIVEIPGSYFRRSFRRSMRPATPAAVARAESFFSVRAPLLRVSVFAFLHDLRPLRRRRKAYSWRGGRIDRNTPKPGFARLGYRGTSAGGTRLTDAVPPAPRTRPSQR